MATSNYIDDQVEQIRKFNELMDRTPLEVNGLIVEPRKFITGLNPTHRKILKVLLNPDSKAETNREIAKEIGKSKTMVDHYILDIYKAFGVRTCRGLVRFHGEIKRVLGV